MNRAEMGALEQHVKDYQRDGFSARIEVMMVGGDKWYARVMVYDRRRDLSWFSYETGMHWCIEDALDELERNVRDE